MSGGIRLRRERETKREKEREQRRGTSRIGKGPNMASESTLNGCLGPTERGCWRGVGRKGWQRVGEGLAKGLRRVGEGLADFLAPFNFGIPEAPV